MTHTRHLVFVGLLVLVVLLVGCADTTTEPATATMPAPTSTAAQAPPTETIPPTDVPPTATDAPAATKTTASTATADAPATETPATERSQQITFQLVPEESEARFIINEELFGQPKTVVGMTNAVSGTLTVDLGTLPNTTVGAIRVDGDTFVTDSPFRNRAIRERILQTDREEFRYIVFTPTQVEGLPESVAVGESFSFQVTGDLTVRDITNPATFDVTVTPVSETRLEGQGSTVILRDTYDLQIPNVPNVANVSNEVGLELDFVAETG